MALKRGFRCEMLKQAIPVENVTGGEDFPRWLVRDDEALVAVLRREKATGANEG
jgi:hypothetical protein